MNRQELLTKIATDTGLSKKDCDAVLASFINSTVTAVKEGDNVALIGFGTFSSNQRAARTGKNPLTGEVIKIAAKKVPHFKPGKAFKDALN